MTADDLASELWSELTEKAEADATKWFAGALVESGSERTVEPLSEHVRQRAKTIIKAVDARPRECWANARRASQSFDDAQYVEGYVNMGELFPFPHAWIEFDGYVVELTMKERPDPPQNAVYIGIEYDDEAVQRATEQSRYGEVSNALRFLEFTSS